MSPNTQSTIVRALKDAEGLLHAAQWLAAHKPGELENITVLLAGIERHAIEARAALVADSEGAGA
jgi:hypothetical protein